MNAVLLAMLLLANSSQLVINTLKWETVTVDTIFEARERVSAPFAISKNNSITKPNGYIYLIDIGLESEEINKVLMHISARNEKNATSIELKSPGIMCSYDFEEICDSLENAQIADLKCYAALLEIHAKDSKVMLYSAPAYIKLNHDLRTIKLADAGDCEEKVEISEVEEIPVAATDEPETPLTNVPKVTDVGPEQNKYLCILNNAFKDKIKLSPDSKIYKFSFWNDENPNKTLHFETAEFEATNHLKKLVDSLTIEPLKSNLRKWVENDSVAFIFEGWASAPEIKGNQITADMGKVIFYRWDRTSNCLVEQFGNYNGSSIKNADLPILRACDSAYYFSSNLKDIIPDINARIFPVALDPPIKGEDLPCCRVVNVYIIARPQLAELNKN